MFSFLARVGAEGLQSACSGAVRGPAGERRSSSQQNCTEVGRARRGRRVVEKGGALSDYNQSAGWREVLGEPGPLLARAWLRGDVST